MRLCRKGSHEIETQLPENAACSNGAPIPVQCDGWARPPRARELCGAIQAIDVQTHTLTVQSPKRDRPFALVLLVWKRETKFLHNWKSTDAASLNEGTQVCLY